MEQEGDGMSILIKGMEMPENCDKCRFQSALRLYCDAMPYNFCGNTDDIERPDFCPLIEVPTPHGDLVDRTELLAEYDRQHKGPAGGARRIMEQATAIIKAEE